MSSSSDSGRSRRSIERPVLPPIRDLFRELSSSRVPPESPALTLARLRVSDEEDPRNAYGPGPQPRLTSSRPPSRSHTDPSTFVQSQHSRFNSTPSTVYDRPRPSSQDPRARGPYPPPDFQSAPTRTMSYDRAAYPPSPAYPAHRTTVPTHDLRGARPPYDYNPAMSQPQPQSQPIPPYYARAQASSSAMLPIISTTTHARGGGEDPDRTPVARFQSSGMVGFAPPDASLSAIGPTKYECSYCGKGFSRPSSLKIHLNSHTGEKPFICPVDGCGRSFSVLSNMRRHARVHVTPMTPTGDAPPLASTSSHPAWNPTSSTKWKHRRNSSASASSSSSRRTRSESSEDDEDYDRPKKHTRK
ncbi:hypothetical protein B0H16DRAFT_1726140 [Mycena metata]|uniref:C2H2-type domain-containing protein n=1 Tax=Mycena metata TaxID=1033252 RepID=A0AAD7INX0_9AGAR|nr:hypothetical protein B0H16DRAFT_1726140 [Mycena metata]